MKDIKREQKILMVAALAVCIISMAAGVLGQDELTSTGETTTDVPADTHPSRFGLFDMVVRPIRATIEQARRLLSPHSSNVSEQIDSLRLETFKMFMRLYNKTYPADEIPRRMALFFQRRTAIVESQKLFEQGKSMFAMRENEYTDWDEDEIKTLAGVSLPSPDKLLPEEGSMFDNEVEDNELLIAQVRNRRADSDLDVSNEIVGDENVDDDDSMMVTAESIPASKDWRKSGCVAAPINQLRCGACYAIATMSVVESMRCIKKVSSPILSPQQIVDCATSRAGYENYGCDGGWPTRVLRYLQDHKIAAREKCYPFVARQNTCKLNQVKGTNGCTVAAAPSEGTIQYKVLRNERDILYHVANTGPVVTVMKATDKFLYYSRGVFDDTKCSRRSDDVDHAIVIVGYGKENGVDYWLIKNSWGITTWGQGGYGLFRRGRTACSIGHWGWVVTA